MIEKWTDVPEWEGMYQVSNCGNVRSVDRTVTNVRTLKFKGRALRPGTTQGGYLQVMFSRDGKHFNQAIHRLVLETFMGPCPLGMSSCHNDGDQKNNHLDNLRWDTQSNNLLDKVAHGTSDRGAANSQAKLDDARRRSGCRHTESAQGWHQRNWKTPGCRV